MQRYSCLHVKEKANLVQHVYMLCELPNAQSLDAGKAPTKIGDHLYFPLHGDLNSREPIGDKDASQLTQMFGVG